MGRMIKGILILAFLCGVAYGLGVRVHPEVLTSGLSSGVPEKQTLLTFTNGQSLRGEIVKETPNGVVFLMDGAQVVFSNSEIASRKDVVPNLEAKAEGLTEKLKSVVSYDPSLSALKSLSNLHLGGAKPKTTRPAASSLWGTRPKTEAVSSSNARAADPNSLMGVYQKSMSQESLNNWKNEASAQLNATRNPFVEMKHAAEDAEKNKAAQVNKMKEIEAKMAAMDSQ